MGEHLYELIPGTTIPISFPSPQPEGRDTIEITEQRHPVSLMERLGSRDDVSPAELAAIDASLRAFDARPVHGRTLTVVSGDVSDATTGNLALQLFEVPQGMEARLTNLLVDTPSSTTITPTAPVSPTGAYAFISKAPPSSADNDTFAVSMRPGMLAFAPTSSGGPIIPGQWTFNDREAPVAFGGEMFWYCLVGNSQTTLQALTIQCRTRVNLYARTTP